MYTITMFWCSKSGHIFSDPVDSDHCWNLYHAKHDLASGTKPLYPSAGAVVLALLLLQALLLPAHLLCFWSYLMVLLHTTKSAMPADCTAVHNLQKCCTAAEQLCCRAPKLH